ncbi:MAG: hypothetical protein ACRERS_10050, partial [Methylococcales bacterium]
HYIVSASKIQPYTTVRGVNGEPEAIRRLQLRAKAAELPARRDAHGMGMPYIGRTQIAQPKPAVERNNTVNRVNEMEIRQLA